MTKARLFKGYLRETESVSERAQNKLHGKIDKLQITVVTACEGIRKKKKENIKV